MTYVKEGGMLPENFDGASKETVLTAEKGSHYTITIPQGKDARLVIDVRAEEGASAAFLSGSKRVRPFPSHGSSRAETGKGPASLLRTMSLRRMQGFTYRARKAASPRPSSMTSVTAYSPLVPVPTSMRPNSAERRSSFTAMESSPAMIPR